MKQEHPVVISRRVWSVAWLTGVGAFMALLDSSIVNLALETLCEEFHVSLYLMQWVVSGYLLALTVSLPSTAILGRRYGHVVVWKRSLTLFIASSLLCGLASDIGLLIAARILQGLTAGVMVPAGQAWLRSEAKPTQLGRLMGVVGMAVALGPVLGPVAGGALLERLSWRWLFWMNVPLGLIALVGAWGFLESQEKQSVSRSPALGGEPSKGILVDTDVLRIRTLRIFTFICALTGANLYCGLLLLPLYFFEKNQLSEAEVGGLLMLMGLGSALALPLAGELTDRRGPVSAIRWGSMLLITSTIPFFGFEMPIPILGACLLIRGVGLALAQMPAFTAAYSTTPARYAGDVSVLVNVAQRLGGVVGTLLVAMLVGGSSHFQGGLLIVLLLGSFTAAVALRENPIPGLEASGTRACHDSS